jgi:nitrile hydratase accessory protein
MSSALLTQLDVDGPAAPPRSNGELVFAAPWESRVFAMAVSMAESGQFAWEEFRGHLVERIAAWEQEAAGEWSYYECWLDALERLVVERGIAGAGALDERAEALGLRPPGHDHRPDDHGHQHDDHGHG